MIWIHETHTSVVSREIGGQAQPLGHSMNFILRYREEYEGGLLTIMHDLDLHEARTERSGECQEWDRTCDTAAV